MKWLKKGWKNPNEGQMYGQQAFKKILTYRLVNGKRCCKKNCIVNEKNKNIYPFSNEKLSLTWEPYKLSFVNHYTVVNT